MTKGLWLFVVCRALYYPELSRVYFKSHEISIPWWTNQYFLERQGFVNIAHMPFLYLLVAGWLREVSTDATPCQLITEWRYPKIISATKRCCRAADRNMLSLDLLGFGCCKMIRDTTRSNRWNRWSTLNLLTQGSVWKIYQRSMSLREDFLFWIVFFAQRPCRSHLFKVSWRQCQTSNLQAGIAALQLGTVSGRCKLYKGDGPRSS